MSGKREAASTPKGPAEAVTLRARVHELEARVAELEAQLAARDAPGVPGRKAERGETSKPYPLRCTAGERKQWERAAKAAGVTLAAWVRQSLDEGAADRCVRWPVPGSAAALRIGPGKTFTFRATAQERARWEHAAAGCRLPLTVWQRNTLDARAAR